MYKKKTDLNSLISVIPNYKHFSKLFFPSFPLYQTTSIRYN